MLDVILFAIQQLVKFLSQSINYSSIPIQYSCLLTVTTINTQTTHTTVATANSVATAVALTDVQLIVILHLWNILPNIIHLPFFFFPEIDLMLIPPRYIEESASCFFENKTE